MKVAIKNSGTEIRLMVPKVRVRSIQVPGCIAARSPSAIDNGTEMIATIAARNMVLPRRPPIRLEIEAPPAFDVPRSPVIIPPSQWRYCIGKGLSSPRSARKAAHH